MAPGEPQSGDYDNLPPGLCNRRVCIETYGCRYNFGDTAKLTEVLKHRGCSIADSVDDADVVIVNTCTVVGPTERRMLRRLSALRDRDLFVTGCMPQVQKEAILSVCDPGFIAPDAIQEWYRRVGTVAAGSVGIVQLAQGCNGTCTYCITRQARGPLRSFPLHEVRRQVAAYAACGAAEIQLTAQDVSSYGKDIGLSLAGLLNDIGDPPGSYCIRVGMMNPATVMDDLDAIIDAFSAERIFRFLHLPVQSGSDTILERMGRQYTVRDFCRIIAAFRKRYPEITVMTDMIAGFPGETEEDFSASIDLIRRLRPNKVNVTRYSKRPFTPLSQEKDILDSVKKNRSRIMLSCSEQVYAEVNRPWLGREVPFIVTETIREGSVMARSPAYQGIVINEDLPVGYEGHAVLRKDRKYFFIGERVT
ncbi:tRNA (N(6)-L-threonylcarbamoyladenosine(37)-C(2))-methylthiotransferase [Methanoregula formicica]|uniref:tRNA-t(6)A37 methylthiotransferase n=1 Tax=Methanoregula formicica (strain DSM 22288 / NBRC 105244 / SMSP) TaxID=593750 RepID=L0HKV4_METFS|nr:tRNA (N(6)-L-threonylcarbamoyladenosine(37)-C(2))-methylthiotransferase [Methanoregula formicica]AGB03674.1 MiaB-like tRNA modifying enzyme [Methanoregula formicica SMSP]